MPTTIGTLADAVLLCQNIRAERAPFSYDIETNGLRAETSDIIGMSISWKRGTFYFPLLHHEPMRDAYAGGLARWAAEVAEYDEERAQGVKKKDRKWATKPKKPVKATFEEQTADLPMEARNVSQQAFWGCIADLFSDPTVPKFAHNSPFDFRRIKKTAKEWTGREIPFVAANFHDTLIMTYALSEHLARVWGGLDLNTVAANTVGVRKSEKALEEWFSARGVKKKGTQKGSLAFAPLELVADYCGMDAILVRKVARVQLPKVQADEGCLKLYRREIALVETTIAMEDAPKHIALERAKSTYATGKERLVSLKAAVVDLGLPHTDNAAWNPDSNDELAKVLRKMGCHLPFAPATKEKFERGEEVETIKYSVDAKALEPHRRLPIISALLRYRRLEKRIGTDFANVLFYTLPSPVDPAMGYLHGGLSQTTARTGRFACLAAGTPVEVVRDVKKHPLMPIESVRAGDLVYTYDDDLRLTLRKVTWAGNTGTRAVVRVSWAGTGKKRDGYVDATPEHRFRLWNGEYRAAKDLRAGDRILAVSRGEGAYEYQRMWASKTEAITNEHRWIYETMRGPIPAKHHIHHKDGNRRNNLLSNLECVSPKEHVAKHPRTTEQNAKMGATLRRMYAEGKMRRTYKRGADNPKYKFLKKSWMLKVLWAHAGAPTVFRDKYRIDYAVVQREMARHGIDYRAIQLFFRPDGTRITREDVAKAREMGNQIDALKFIGKGYAKFRELQTAFGFEDTFNHTVTSVVALPGRVPVYDISVEGTHNFIANELCVHNSSAPNMQNWTRDDDSDEWASEFSIRAAWVVAPPACGCKICDGSGAGEAASPCWACGGTGDARRVIISADLKQIEPRITAHLTKDENLIRVYREGRDVYVEIGKIAFGLEPALPDKEWKKKYPDERQAAKAIVLAILYGAGISKIRFMVTDSVMEVIDGRLAFLKRKWEAGDITEEGREALLAEVKALKKRRATFSFGDEDSRRVLDKMAERFPGIFDYKAYLTEGYERRKYVRNPWGRKLYLPHEDATYMLLNAIVQSSAADLLKQATLDVYRALKESGLDCNLLWSIHDELLFDCLAADAEKASAIIVREMTKFPLRVPLESDLSITATSLKDAIEWDLKDGVPWEKLWGISN